MGKNVSHILISCHEEDCTDMRTLMIGMSVHSDFINWHVNEFHDACADLIKAATLPPKLQLWHGFTSEGFAWNVLAALMTSVGWQREDRIVVMLEGEYGFEKYSLMEFYYAVQRGEIK